MLRTSQCTRRHFGPTGSEGEGLTSLQITCLYDMDIPRPDSFNETYLYEGGLARMTDQALFGATMRLTDSRAHGM